MVQEVAVREHESQTDAVECRHHWIIEPPHGATSWGECKVCGARKEFPNSAGDALWERDSVGSFSSRWSGTASPAPSLPSAGLGERREEEEGF